VKLVYHICEKRTAGGKHIIGYVGSELDIRFGKMFGYFLEKVKISRFKV